MLMEAAEMSRCWGWRSAFGIPGAHCGRGERSGESPSGEDTGGRVCGRSAEGLSRGRSDLVANEGGVRSAP